MTGDTALLEALAALTRAREPCGRSFMLIGGLAVIARGIPRDTDGIDATVWALDRRSISTASAISCDSSPRRSARSNASRWRTAAVQASLRAAAEVLLQGHLRHCVTGALRSGDPVAAEAIYRELTDLMKKYGR